MSGVESYRYSPPSRPGAGGVIDVLPVPANDPMLRSHAWVFQRIMNIAWVKQFQGTLSESDIAKTVDNMSPDMVKAQAERLSAPKTEGQPAYVQGVVFENPISQRGTDLRPFVAGFGKSKTAGREAHPPLADISDIYVLPDYQRKGIGTAIYRSLLDGYQTDQQLVAYELSANPKTLQTLKHLGYSSFKSWRVSQFGKRLDQEYLRGPLVGDMIEELERRNPWLAEREPIPRQKSYN